MAPLLESACARGAFDRLARLATIARAARAGALDQMLSFDRCETLGGRERLAGAPPPGCLLVQPPMIGADARAIRLDAEAARVPVLVLAREPLTRDARWPVVTVSPGITWPDERRRAPGGVSIRARVDPPIPLARLETSPTRDEAPTPPASWFAGALRALDEAALERFEPEAPGVHRARTLVELIDAHPYASALYDALIDACHEAARDPHPASRLEDADPFSF